MPHRGLIFNIVKLVLYENNSNSLLFYASPFSHHPQESFFELLHSFHHSFQLLYLLLFPHKYLQQLTLSGFVHHISFCDFIHEYLCIIVKLNCSPILFVFQSRAYGNFEKCIIEFCLCQFASCHQNKLQVVKQSRTARNWNNGLNQN